MTHVATRGGGTYPAEWGARHEAGHCAAYWALGVEFARVTLDGPGGVPVTDPGAGVKPPFAARALIDACGAIADYQGRGLTVDAAGSLELLRGSRDNRFALLDARTGALAERVDRAPAVEEGADLREVVAQLALKHISTAVSYWADCQRFARSARPEIDVITAALLERRELTGAEVAALCASVSPRKPALPMFVLLALEEGTP